MKGKPEGMGSESNSVIEGVQKVGNEIFLELF